MTHQRRDAAAMEALRATYPPLFRRHARRPRLTRLLDESTAQTILVTAPAGYGKTTLAMEWLQGRDDAVWYRATSGAADVAAFSAALADVVAPLVPGAGDRLKQRLGVADSPERAARPLAEILSEDLEAWPRDALLVIDDYHLVADSASVEEFMDWLLMLTPGLHVLVTTRRRPKWASARRILYGEITEIGRAQLAMTNEEAALVLDGRSGEEVQALVQQAEGWPALIGLAALSATHEIPTEGVSDALYRYFAEEVLRGEPSDVERFLMIASVPSEIDSRVIREFLQKEVEELVFRRLVENGVVQPLQGGFRFHPLLRSFLRQTLERKDPVLFDEVAKIAIESAREGGRWEEAFDLAIEFRHPEAAIEILGAATPELLAAGQTELLERWLRECGPLGVDHPSAIVARTELLIRQGRLTEAVPLARNLALRLPRNDRLASRAWYLAGLASHLVSREEEALKAHLHAKQLASEPQEQSDALWGAYMAAVELEMTEASSYLAEMEGLGLSDAAFRLRIATGRIGAAMAAGDLRGVNDMAYPLIPLTEHVNEPMVETSFLARVAETQAVRARYDEALAFASSALTIAEDLHLEFAIGLCLVPRINAEIGLRRFDAARRSLKTLLRITLSREDPYLELARHVLHLKLRLSHRGHRFTEVRLPEHIWQSAHIALRAEYLSLRALDAARGGSPTEALSLSNHARELSNSVDSRFSSQFAAIIAQLSLDRRKEAFHEAAIRLVRECGEVDALEPLVLAARTDYQVVETCSVDSTARAIFRNTLFRSGDHVIARKAGLVSEDADEPAMEGLDSVLTPRELEVLGLLSHGLSNSAIATQLVISESTVKAHVHHILEKLGVATRLQAVLKATPPYTGVSD